MSITSQLNTLINLLINQYYIYKFFHWNFEGESFYSYQQLFDTHAHNILKSQDAIAQQVRALQCKVLINPVLTPLKDIDINQKNLHNILGIIINEHNSVIQEITEIINLANYSEDFAISDLLTQFLEEQQKMLWFVQSSDK